MAHRAVFGLTLRVQKIKRRFKKQMGTRNSWGPAPKPLTPPKPNPECATGSGRVFVRMDVTNFAAKVLFENFAFFNV